MAINLHRVDRFRWVIPKTGNMRVPGLIFSSDELIKDVRRDESLVQVTNVAMLPGIVSYALGMPDIHWGYGFPIGGVAAFDADEGIISPGGVGYDINCGCRLMTTSLLAADIRAEIKPLVTALFNNIPTGVGSTGGLHLSKKEEASVALQGAAWAVNQGFGDPEDLDKTEDRGTLTLADPSVLSERAAKRGMDQLGTLGSGNHFLEIQSVEKIYDPVKARAFGLFEGQFTLMIHSGSRGFGHQICDDFLKEMGLRKAKDQPSSPLPDRQLVYADLHSDTGKRYLAAMACAANYAWANRQILMHWTRETLMQVLAVGPKALGMRLLFDVCHNIAKMEHHVVDGQERVLCVHRKGATRSFPPGHPLLPPIYRDVGQPVLIPGDMGTFSYVLAGAEGARNETFASTCHGAGRVLSRNLAIKRSRGRAIHRELEDQGIFVLSRGKQTLKEEMPEAYKDVSHVVEVVHETNLACKVARLRPMGVIKG